MILPVDFPLLHNAAVVMRKEKHPPICDSLDEEEMRIESLEESLKD
jgi:hypothetical protein